MTWMIWGSHEDSPIFRSQRQVVPATLEPRKFPAATSATRKSSCHGKPMLGDAGQGAVWKYPKVVPSGYD